MRAISRIPVCSFACTIQRAFGWPLFYVHVSFPNEIRGAQLRAAAHVKVDIAAQIAGAGVAAQPCKIVNLAISGALIASWTRMAAQDDTVHLRLSQRADPVPDPVQLTALGARMAGSRPTLTSAYDPKQPLS